MIQALCVWVSAAQPLVTVKGLRASTSSRTIDLYNFAMQVIRSVPNLGSDDNGRNNIIQLASLLESPSDEEPLDIFGGKPASFEERPDSSELFYKEALVIFTGKLDVPELIKDALIADWLTHGGKLILAVGSWFNYEFDPSFAKKLLGKTQQTSLGAALFGRNPVKFYSVPRMHMKLAARCDYDPITKKYKVKRAIIGSTNLTKGALEDVNYELDVLFEADDNDALGKLTEFLGEQLSAFEEGIGVDLPSTEKVQKVFEQWRVDEQHRIAGHRNNNLPRDH